MHSLVQADHVSKVASLVKVPGFATFVGVISFDKHRCDSLPEPAKVHLPVQDVLGPHAAMR